MERIRIPIPENAVPVKPSRYYDRSFFVMREQEKPGWIWVEDDGISGVTHEIEPDKIVITTHSPQDAIRDGSKQEVHKQDKSYSEFIDFYEQLLEIVEDQES